MPVRQVRQERVSAVVTRSGWYARPSTRKQTLPPDWLHRRRAVLIRDGHRCQHVRYDTGLPCMEWATDVDHIGNRDDHTLANLQALCAYHHRQKTSSQGGRAAARKREPQKQKHPGII